MNRWRPMLLAGAAVGFAQALFILGGLWEVFPQYKLGLTAVVCARWVTVAVVVALWLQAGWIALDRIESRGGTVPPWEQALLVVAITLVAELTGEPLALEAARATHTALQVPVRPFWQGRPLPGVLMHMWAQGIPAVLPVCALATAIRTYVRSVRDAGDALRRMQLVAAESGRRAVAERLHSTQAAVDPPFLFSTLRGIESAFVREPRRADRMLDALIRYLRAALPAAPDGGCTLGEQAELVRAWIDIGAAASAHAPDAAIDVPPALRSQPFAPLLLLPLAAAATGAGTRRVTLQAWSEPGHLVVEVGAEDAAAGRMPPEFAAVQQRVAVLYGDSASFAAEHTPGGIVARIRLELPVDP